MAEQLAAIEALPEQFGGIAAGFRHATIDLARESAKWIRLSILPTNTFFQGSTLETRLYVTRTNNKLLFGFIRRPGETAVIMDATVNLRFEIAEREFRGMPVSPESVLHTAIVPSFFQAAVPADQVLKAAKVLGSNPAEIFFLQLDAGVLAVVRPDDFQRALVAWQRSPGDAWVLAVQSAGPGSSAGRVWQIPPFLALSRTVGLWIKRGFDSGEPTPISLPAQADTTTERAALYLLRQLTAAWIQVVNRIQNRVGEPEEPILDLLHFLPEYQAAGYEAKVLLRLDPNGQLAFKGDRDDLFQLQAALTLDEDDHGVARSKITIGPPDFLSAGPLYEAFLDTLVDTDTALRIASQLGLPGQEFAIREFLHSARSSPLDAPLVFRVKHGKRDTDLITLHGTLSGLLQHVVLQADFTVDLAADPMVRIDSGSLAVLYTDRERGALPQAERGTELVQYFLRLLTFLRNWHRALT